MEVKKGYAVNTKLCSNCKATAWDNNRNEKEFWCVKGKDNYTHFGVKEFPTEADVVFLFENGRKRELGNG